MTRQEMNDAVAAYLEQHEESYEDVINSLSKVIRNYYDERERKKKQAEARRKKIIDESRNVLIITILDYIQSVTDEEMSKEEYEETYKMIDDILKKEVEPAISKFKKLIQLDKSDEEVLLNYVKGLI